MSRKVTLTILTMVHDAPSGERIATVRVKDAVTEELIQEVEMDGQRAELLQRRGPFDLEALHVGTETAEEVRVVPGTTAGEEETARVEAERLEAERIEAERVEQERLEAERLAAEEAALAEAEQSTDAPADAAVEGAGEGTGEGTEGSGEQPYQEG